MTFIISTIIWLVAMYFVFTQATAQKRSVLLWCIAGLIVTPVIPAVVLFVLGKNKATA